MWVKLHKRILIYKQILIHNKYNLKLEKLQYFSIIKHILLLQNCILSNHKSQTKRALFFKFFGNTQPILLYWFAAQQEASTSRQQYFYLFYPKFSPQFNKLGCRKWQKVKATESGKNMAKTKTVQKTTYMWHSPYKG